MSDILKKFNELISNLQNEIKEYQSNKRLINKNEEETKAV